MIGAVEGEVGPEPEFERGKVAAWCIVISSLITWFIALLAGLIFLPSLIVLLGSSDDVAYEMAGILVYAVLLAITLGYLSIDGDRRSIVEMLKIPSIKAGVLFLLALPIVITIVDYLAVLIYYEVYEALFGYPEIIDMEYPVPESEYDLIISLIFISTVIAAPIVEEIMFRGYVLDAIREIHGDTVAVLGSAVMFGILHIDPYVAGLAALGGIVYGWIRIETGSLWPSIISHMIWNGIFFYVTYFL